MRGCMLTISSRSSSTVGCAMSINIPSRQVKEHQAWAIGSTLPTAPFTKVANGPFKWGLQHRFGLASPGAGHLWGKQLPGAKQPCKAPLDTTGRHVAWCARRAREIRHNRLRDFPVEYVKESWITLLDLRVDCMWMMWMADVAQGHSAKGLASTVSRYTSVELALHP